MKKNEIIFGTRSVIETIHAGQEIEKIFVQTGLSNPRVKELLSVARRHNVPLSFIPRQKLNRLSAKNHQGVVAVRSAIRYSVFEDIVDNAYSKGKDPFFLLLDRITDVGNFGAIVRTAECAGLDAIIVAQKGSVPLTGDVMKTSAGGLNHLPVCRSHNLKESIRSLKEHGVKVVACLEKAEKTLYEIEMTSPLALLVGSEQDGIAPSLLREADEQAGIPMYGQIKSLNVSVAVGIALYEVIRQKNYKNKIG